MPELPDLVHLVRHRGPALRGRRLSGARVSEPIVLRLLETGNFSDLVAGQALGDLARHGPFLRFDLDLQGVVCPRMESEGSENGAGG